MSRTVLLAAVFVAIAFPAFATLPLYRAGSIVETHVELRGEADEMELVLEIEKPLAQSIRLTPEFLSDQKLLRWRVPDVVAESASLRLRVGHDGEETLGPELLRFRIEHRQGDRIEFREGEWWPSDESPASGPAGVESDSTLSPEDTRSTTAVIPRSPAAAVPAVHFVSFRPFSEDARAGSVSPPRDASPAVVPQRK
jgi:hypothetical protein